jgi:transposase InsO family protein
MLTFENYFLQQNYVPFLQVRMTYSQIISSFVTFACFFSYLGGCRTTSYHPQGNGQVERFNQTLLNMLGTLDEEKKPDCKSFVAPLVHSYNATRQESTGYNPHFLMFGWHPSLCLPLKTTFFSKTMSPFCKFE